MFRMYGQKMTQASGWDRQRAISNHPADPISVLKSVGAMSNSRHAVEHRLHFAKAGRATRDMEFEEVIATMRETARESSSFLARGQEIRATKKRGSRAAADANIARMERELEGRERGWESGYTQRRAEQELPGRYQ